MAASRNGEGGEETALCLMPRLQEGTSEDGCEFQMLSFPLSIPGSGCPPSSCEVRCSQGLPGQQPLHRGSSTYYAQDLKDSRVPEAISRARDAPWDCLPLSLQEETAVPRCLSGTSIQCKFQPKLIQLPPRSLQAVLSLGLPVLSHGDSAGNTTY